MKFTVVGAGYVGLSLSVMLSQKYVVKLFDIDHEKIAQVSSKKSPIKDREIQDYLQNHNLKLTATTNSLNAFEDVDYVVVATPTNYDSKTGNFDTLSVENVIKEALSINSQAFIIIKSTIPIGFVKSMRLNFNTNNIVFSPEFLREGSALKDNLFPSRIIVGDYQEKSKIFADILCECSKVKKKDIKIFFMESDEAEAVKLFANTYLAMRISFFNELDSFSQSHNLSTENIIRGVSSDNRIGNFYNNPSFGYGGYCLPKDTKQLLSNFDKIPSELIEAIIISNETRKDFISQSIINLKPKTVGVYRLAMKFNSDNLRESAVMDIIKKLRINNIKICIYEPSIKNIPEETQLIENLEEFISNSDIIIANRMSSELEHVKNKVYTRDVFGKN